MQNTNEKFKVGDLLLMQDLNFFYISRVEIIVDTRVKFLDFMECNNNKWVKSGTEYEFTIDQIQDDVLYNFGQIEFESIDQLKEIAPEHFI